MNTSIVFITYNVYMYIVGYKNDALITFLQLYKIQVWHMYVLCNSDFVPKPCMCIILNNVLFPCQISEIVNYSLGTCTTFSFLIGVLTW